jgi:N-acetylmuramoyl-L-alanine amidase
MIYKVSGSAGHGGNDPGAIAAGKFKESVMALTVTSAFCKELKKDPRVNVKQTRTSDINQSITTKVNMANSFGADLALDIHFNAGGGDGAEVWCSHVGGTGEALAKNILKRFEEIGQNSRGVKTRLNESGQDYFGFIRMTKMPAVIVECGFIDNATDRKLFDTPAELKKMGVAIAKGVLDTITQENNKKRSETKSEAMTGYYGTFPTLPSRGYFKIGDKGLMVRRLQALLNWSIEADLDKDGIVGAATIAAVKKFQEEFGLKKDGYFGKKCLAAAKKILK